MLLPDISVFPDSSLDVQRLFHGRGHAFPGLEHLLVDWYPPVIIVTSFRELEGEWLDALVDQLRRCVPDVQGVAVQYRVKSGVRLELLWGEVDQSLIVGEAGLKYHVQLGNNQNTGFFLDIANGRQWVREHSKGKRVLNLFAYTCSFSVAALDGGADHVANFDMSRSSLTTGRENHRLNEQDTTRIAFERVDIFRSFGRIRRYGPFDLLVCDPPSFQKGSVDIKKDYRKILRRLPEFMSPGSDLLLCLNDPSLTVDFLMAEVESACPSARFVERIPNPGVFIEQTPGAGLKVLHYLYCPQE